MTSLDKPRPQANMATLNTPEGTPTKPKSPMKSPLRSPFKKKKPAEDKDNMRRTPSKYGTKDATKYIIEQYSVIKNYDFLFENISFEGGGAKLVAYVGAIQVRLFEYFSFFEIPSFFI